MQISIKSLLHNHLSQLLSIVTKIPHEIFHKQLAPDMFSLAENAKIAANFSLRGYCPLVDQKTVAFEEDGSTKEGILRTIQKTLSYLDSLPEVTDLDSSRRINDKAGFTTVDLPQPQYIHQYIHQYILPNLLFHISMVYAIARHCGVTLSKGDFDGFHSYPIGFGFI
ncbi:DUF1993 family protein [Microbulbifer sp. TRSA002]|uniref:DUF1993 family protein n=1 Tax=Microbulbifer sp. TRSA002 TaxID=3243382 RepID=UPI004039C500